MKNICSAIAVVGLAWGGTSAASAQDGSRDSWQLAEADQSCIVERSYSVDGAPLRLQLERPLAQPSIYAQLSGPLVATYSFGDDLYSLAYSAAFGRRELQSYDSVYAQPRPGTAEPRWRMVLFPEVETARDVMLHVKHSNFEIDVPIGSIAAIEAMLAECDNAILARWGVDVVANATLQRRPVPVGNTQSWIQIQDYPAESLANREEGRASLLLMVDISGRVRSCSVMASSGFPTLDSTACRLMMERARFRPAIAADGNPAEGYYLKAINWAVPDD